ncbi:MAG TPA: hypothetical protein VK590_02020 [Saprospiraceae bacterium]|nr:hypothetical protein [Saprospiraceae bacterium]
MSGLNSEVQQVIIDGKILNVKNGLNPKTANDHVSMLKTQSRRNKFVELSSDGQDRMTRQKQRLQRKLADKKSNS